MKNSFNSSAQYYDEIYSFKNYGRECETISKFIEKYKRTDGNVLLDVACGTGQHINFLKHSFACQGIDLAEDLLFVARQRNPGIEFTVADMTDFDLGSQFDVVTCLFSAIGYVENIQALEAAIQCMSNHLKPGGVIVIEPWFSAENYHDGRVHAIFVDKPQLKIARMNVSATKNDCSTLEFHYLIATPDGVHNFVELHKLGLFSHTQHIRAMEKANLEVRYDPVGLMDRGLYVGVKN